MNLTAAASEIMRRESDRECRRNYGFGLDEIPPMSQWEMKVRKTAIDASHSASYQKGRPTSRQRSAIEEYNQVARRYRALADAEFEIRLREIVAEIAKERAAGTYREPGLAEGARGSAITLWLLCISVLLLAVWSDASIAVRASSPTSFPSTVPVPVPSTSSPVCATPNPSHTSCLVG